MKPLNTAIAGTLALGLVACGGAEDRTPDETMQEETSSNETVDQSGHDMGALGETIGHGAGAVRSIGAQSEYIVISHGPLKGIDMGAMTMGFDIMGDTDLSGFTEGDEVAFMIKQGRDGSYRIMEICNTATEGADCLDGVTDDQS